MIYTADKLIDLLRSIKKHPSGVSVTSEKKELIQARQPVVKAANEKGRCCVCLEDDGDEDNAMLRLESCGHIIHIECAKGQLAAGWAGKRVSFGFMSCGECRVPMFHKKLKKYLEPHIEFKKKVEQISYLKCCDDKAIEGLKSNVLVSDPRNKQVISRCLDIQACFLCHSCKQPFCAGRVDCAEDEELDLSTLTCASCAFEVQRQAQKKYPGDWRGKCHTHGYKYAMYKCDSCCSMATYDCRSNHYCERCHNMAYSSKDFPCPGQHQCPLGIEHPPNQSAIHGENNGEFIQGFVIGCFKCFTNTEEGDPDPVGFMHAESQWKDRF